MPETIPPNTAQILGIFASLPKTYGSPSASTWHQKQWTSAIHKQPVHQPIQLSQENLQGDAQADLKNHGGPHRALLLYSSTHYPFWRKQLDRPTLPFGAFGENITVSNFTEKSICIGDTFTLGSTIIQVSQPRPPCWKLARLHRIKHLPTLVQETGYAGWYCRVLQTGTISPSDTLTLTDRPCPDWSIDKVARLKYLPDKGLPEYTQLALNQYLPPHIRDRFKAKAANPNFTHDSAPRLVGPNEN
ncbi:MOSC domain-containing protein [Planctomycetota bacterium]|nr:MOSC domain-containing protein [Planctomycetota bacterium]